MRTRLTRLAEVCNLAYEAEVQRVRPLYAAEQSLQAELARLDEMCAARSAEIGRSDTLDPACRASADLHWQKWLAARRRGLSAERARLRAEIERNKAQVARAFGRREVARKLVENAGRGQTS